MSMETILYIFYLFYYHFEIIGRVEMYQAFPEESLPHSPHQMRIRKQKMSSVHHTHSLKSYFNYLSSSTDVFSTIIF